MDERRTITREQAIEQAFDMEPESEAQLPAVREDRARVRQAPVVPPADVVALNARGIVRMSEQVDQLFAAMAEAQAMDGYGDIEKSRTARIKSKREGGADYSYTYETLKDVIAATQPFLAKVGIAQFQFPFPGSNYVTIRTLLAHKSGQWISNDLSATIAMPEPKDVGGGISYLRRYALKSVCNVAADNEDDAGEQTAHRSTAPRPAERRSQQAPPQQKSEPKASEPLTAQAPHAAPSTPSAPAAAVAQVLGARPGDVPSTIGVVAALKGNADWTACGVILNTGAKASTRNAELIKALRRHEKNGSTIELVCHANPKEGLAPIIDEIVEHRPQATKSDAV